MSEEKVNIPILRHRVFFMPEPHQKGMRTTDIEHDDNPIPDAALGWLILGCFRGAAQTELFPIKVDHIEDNFDDDGQIQTFTIVTESGLRFTTSVTYEPEPPTPNTKEENITFRKAWDDQVEKGKS